MALFLNNCKSGVVHNIFEKYSFSFSVVCAVFKWDCCIKELDLCLTDGFIFSFVSGNTFRDKQCAYHYFLLKWIINLEKLSWTYNNHRYNWREGIPNTLSPLWTVSSRSSVSEFVCAMKILAGWTLEWFLVDLILRKETNYFMWKWRHSRIYYGEYLWTLSAAEHNESIELILKINAIKYLAIWHIILSINADFKRSI